MQFLVRVNEHGKITNGAEQIAQYLIKELKGKTCTFTIQEENTQTTTKECRDAYFFKVDLVSKATGDERYDIHEAFKKAYYIGSTKDFSVVDWRNFIKKFQEYIFDNLDIII
jgi:hypothetical protein